jgi:tetratricopeptide (TPR) repeat protein
MIDNIQIANEHFDLGLNLELRGDLEGALKEFLEAIGNDQNFAEAFNKTGDIYTIWGRFDEALVAYEKAYQLKPKSENVLFDLGTCLLRIGKFEDSKNIFLRLQEIDPSYPGVFLRLGEVMYFMGEFSRSEEYLKKAILEDPADIGARYILGRTLLKMNRTQDAKVQFEKVLTKYSSLIEVNPEHAEAYYFSGKVYFYMDDMAKASWCFSKAIELDTDEVYYHQSHSLGYSDCEAFISLCETYLIMEETDNAYRAIKSALTLEPFNPRANELKSRFTEFWTEGYEY